MAISLVPFITLFNWLASTGYPLWESCVFLNSGAAAKDASTQWIAFWVIRAVLSVIETYVLVFVADYIPLFYELRFLAYFWLVAPQFMGAAYLWELVGKQYFAVGDKHVMSFFSQVAHKAKEALGDVKIPGLTDAKAKRKENFEKSQKDETPSSGNKGGSSPSKKN